MVEGFHRQKMKNKIISLLAIAMLLTPCLLSVNVAGSTVESVKKNFNYFNKSWEDLRTYLGLEHWEHARLILYLLVLGIYTWNITSDILLNLNTYILMNPSPLEPSVLNVMNFFIFNLQVAFILAIAATALYIIFSSGAPKKRAKAKSMLGRLVMGMLLVSISPYLMKMFLDLSSGMTETILNQTDSSVAATIYTDIIWKLYYPQVLIIILPMAGHSIEKNTHHVVVAEMGSGVKAAASEAERTAQMANPPDVETVMGQMTIIPPEDDIASIAQQIMTEQQSMIDDAVAAHDDEISHVLHKYHEVGSIEGLTTAEQKTLRDATRRTWLGKLEEAMTYMKVAPHPEQTFAYLMAEIAMTFALYGFLALRYVMLMIWVILFPLSLFLSSFELTRGLGRNMIEQTVFWTILQIFYAISLDVIAVGFMILPAGYDYFGLGLNYTGGLFFISFFSIAAAILLMMTPILVLMLSQRLTQMDLG